MTDAPFADPAPRRRRDRDRAAGAPGDVDSWAHLVGLGGRTADDQAPPEAPASGEDTPRAGTPEPLSRRAARLREARTDGDTPGAPLPPGSSPTASAGLPLRPWWASPAERPATGTAERPADRPADVGAEVPPAFRRASRASVRPEVAPEAPQPVREQPVREQPVQQVREQASPSVREQAVQPVREQPVQPQVNPWPGAVRPARPVPGAVSGRRTSGRTSDLLPNPDLAVHEPGAVLGAPLAPAEIELPREARRDAERGRTAAEVRLPQEARTSAGREPGAAAPVLGRPVLPSAVLPGPVLPGVEPFVEPAAEPAARRSAPGSGAIRLPSTAAAPSTGELDLRLVRDVAADRAQGSAGSGPGSSRRRLGAAPVRFPDLGAGGEPLVADAVPEAPEAPPSSRAAARAGSGKGDTPGSGFLTPGRSRRRGGTPARGVPEAPAVSGPARGILGTGSLTPPAGLLGAPAAGAGAPGGAAGRTAAAAGGADGLDVVAGIGPAGRTSRRRSVADEARGRTGEQPAARSGRTGEQPAARSRTTGEQPAVRSRTTGESRPPLRAVGTPAGDETTSLLRPVRPARSVDPGADRTSGAPGPSPFPERAPDVPLAGARSRRGTGSRRSSGATAALTAVPAPAAGRAGRNLPAAIGVGLGLGAAVLASLLWHKEAFVVVVAAAVLVALWELTRALAKKSVNVPVVPLAVGAVGMLVSAYVAGEDGLLVSFTLTAFGVLLWRIIDGTQGAARDVAAAVFVAAYVPFLAGFATLMLASADGAYRVIVFIAVTVANDVGGYAAGVLFGRHPMAPSISPKKSWEGLAGSFVLCMLVGAGTVYVLLHGPLLAGLAVGAAAAFTATLGDLSESLLKRDLGIKDMGSLLPGHGGIMDRLDSLLPTAPAVALLLAVLVPVAAR